MPLTSALYNPFPEEITVEMVHRPAGPIANLMGGGRARTWTLQRTGQRGRPSYRGLEDLLAVKLEVGQELMLDAPTEDELAQYITEVKKVCRRTGVVVRWDGQERAWVGTGQFSWQRVYRFRAYLVLLARRSGTGWLAPSEHATKLS